MSVAEDYRGLITKFLPRPIRSPAEYRRMLKQIETLLTPHPAPAESLFIELLSTLVENYESHEFPTPVVRPQEVLAHLLENRGLKPAELSKATGLRLDTLSNVLAGRRGISKSNAVKLAKYFDVSPGLFLGSAEDD